MKIMIVANYEQLSSQACAIVSEAILNNNQLVLGLATGATPEGLYNKLIKNQQLVWQDITTFNLDEYIGLAPTNKMSYHFYMHHKLFKHLDIKLNNTHVPSGQGNIAANARAYDKLIDRKGPIDLQILGLGSNAHIGFNEPGANLNDGTAKVLLAQSTINANAKYFQKLADVPTQAITMGIGKILQAKKILLLASGHQKALAIKATIEGNININVPASYLQKHPNVTIIIDHAAANLLENYKKL